MSSYDPYLPPDDHLSDYNPYAPPKADPKRGDLTGEFHRRGDDLEPFSVDAVMRRAWAVFQERMGLSLGIVLGGNALNYAITIPGNILVVALQRAGVSDDNVGILSILYMLAAAPFLLWIYSGQTIALLKLARGEDTAFADVLTGGPFLVRMLFASFMVWLLGAAACFMIGFSVVLVFAIALRQGAALGFLIAGLVGLGAVVAVGAYLIRILLYPYAIVGRNAGVLESLRFSFDVTRGHALELIVLAIITGLINALGLLMCCIGVAFTMPLSMLIGACSYAMLARDFLGDGDHAKNDHRDIEFLEFDS